MQVAGDFRLGETDSAGSGVYARLTGFAGRLAQVWGCLGPAASKAAFLDYALKRLSPEAVARSCDAVFVREGHGVAWTGYGQGRTL